MHKYLLALFILVSSSGLKAQNYHHHNMFWGRISLTDTISTKLRYEIQLQYRSQDLGYRSSNFFSAYQYSTGAFWLSYSLNNNIIIGVLPFSYFHNSALVSKPGDERLRPVKEFRHTARLVMREPYKKALFFNVVLLELRVRNLRKEEVYLSNYRFRHILRFDHPLFKVSGKPLTATIYNEVMFQFGNAVRDNVNIFDQDRVYMGGTYPVYKNIRLGMGYFYTVQQRASGKDFDDSNTLFVNLTFDNLLSQFRK